MFERDGKRFNCCESVIILVNQEIPLSGFGIGIMRGASNLGGGVSGWGSICGAVSGAAMVYGLIAGTEGDESPEEFTRKRETMRGHTQEFLRLFEEKWGHVNCFDDLECDTVLADCSVPDDWLEELEAMEPAERRYILDELAGRPNLWDEGDQHGS